MTGGKSERCNALWGRGGRGSRTAIVLLGAVLALAAAGVRPAGAAPKASHDAYVPASLLSAATAAPDRQFDVIVTANRGDSSGSLAQEVDGQGAQDWKDAGHTDAHQGHFWKRQFGFISGLSASLSGRDIVKLAKNPHVSAISPDYKVARTAFTNNQLWPDAAQVSSFWPSIVSGLTAPTVAVVDSGVDGTHPDLFGQVVASTTFVSSGVVTAGVDGRGHGTFVAGEIAGSDIGHAGVIPGGKLVSVQVLDNSGSGVASDVISGLQWILDHKDQYGIRVVNLSLNSGSGSSFRFDPLDQAVEKLWFNGVVVVVAAGNYGTDALTPSRVKYAPANDPFVITVGASDTNGTVAPTDDFSAPWSAWGYTFDGFAKPDLAAPGRVIDGPVAAGSQMIQLHPERATEPGYMWLSGTSMAAPVVAGTAAMLLADHPTWGPDQVKGALMDTAAKPTGYTAQGALGFGVVQATAADTYLGVANPNAALNAFIVADPVTGARSFDQASWVSAAKANASWDSASWASASWESASWETSAATASWDSASWDSASWDSATTATASWDSASWETSLWVQ